MELVDPAGRKLATARLAEGVAGIARLHAMIGEQLGEDADETQVMVGIETDRGPWVAALVAAGYTVYAINSLSVARYRERHSVSGAKSDPADAHTLADMVRTDAHQLRPVAGDTAEAEAIKVVSRAHKQLIFERTRHTQRLRHALREYFPAALEAFDDPQRYATAKNRKNYAGTSPITRASGKKKMVAARYVHNDRLIDALMSQAHAALNTSPGTRAYYDQQRARGADHNPALHHLTNRLVEILHRRLKTRTLYDETTAWAHHITENLATAALEGSRFRRQSPKWHDGLRGEMRKWDRHAGSTPTAIRPRP